MSLDRFKTAQASDHAGFETALDELRAGQKTSHWIWYIFPQLRALGRSSTAQFYGLEDVVEAGEYLRDPLLREHLSRAVDAVHVQLARGVSLAVLMGGETDCLKLVSSLTLFELAAHRLAASAEVPEITRLAETCSSVLAAAERQAYPRCQFTLKETMGR